MKRTAVILMLALLLASGCRKKSATTGPADAENKVAAREVLLYFESGESTLAAEKRTLPLPENPAAALPLIIRQLAAGPLAPSLGRILPADCVVRGAFLLPGGTAIVDLGGPTLTDGWPAGSTQELMAIYSIVHTVTANVRETQRVRILINGSPAETLAGHISLDRSFPPVRDMVSARPPVIPPAGAKLQPAPVVPPAAAVATATPEPATARPARPAVPKPLAKEPVVTEPVVPAVPEHAPAEQQETATSAPATAS